MAAVLFAVAGPAEAAAVQGQPRSADEASAPETESDEGPYFYSGFPYGSDAYVGPVDVLLNKGFDLAQVENRDRRIFAHTYATAHTADAILHPIEGIDRSGGWWSFVGTQVLPLTFDKRRSKWFPNYFGHAVTGGILARRLAEWLEARHVPAPTFAGGIVTMAGALLNEAYEHEPGDPASAGTIADLYIFDLGGVLLFTHDGIARFFSRRLHANVWPGQASILVRDAELANNGNHLVLKIPWGVVPNTSLFFRTGLDGQLGVTFHGPEGFDVSLALGPEAREIHVDRLTGEEWVDFTATVGAYLDRHGSLLASVVTSGVPHRWLTANLYPGVSGILGGALGGWLVLTRDRKLRIGLSTRITWGAGVGLAW